jgi:hypothetical protein
MISQNHLAKLEAWNDGGAEDYASLLKYAMFALWNPVNL